MLKKYYQIEATLIIDDIKSEVSTLSVPNISGSLNLLSKFKKIDEATE